MRIEIKLQDAVTIDEAFKLLSDFVKEHPLTSKFKGIFRMSFDYEIYSEADIEELEDDE